MDQVRNAAHLGRTDAIREKFRQEAPSTSDGFTVLDLDMVFNVYGPNYGTDSAGRFILTEWKYGGAGLTRGQQWTFKTMHDILRAGDTADRYQGFWKINYTNTTPIDGDRFDYQGVTLHKAVRLFDKPDLVIDGHEQVWQFLTTLQNPRGGSL